jgi:hypothetical protein
MLLAAILARLAIIFSTSKKKLILHGDIFKKFES